MRLELLCLAIVFGVGCSNADRPRGAINTEPAPYVPEGSCPGAAEIPGGATECSSDGDCSDSEKCAQNAGASERPAPDDEDGAPGIACEDLGCSPVSDCTSDADCPVEGESCRRFTTQDCCTLFFDNMACRPPCQPGDCWANEQCDPDGECRPIMCADAEYDCGAISACDPAREGADRHGCVVASCDLDGVECGGSDVCAPERSTRPNDCAPQRCEQGYECGVNEECDAGTEGHGCRKLRCDDADDCDCGVCMDGVCEPRAFYCVPR